MTNQFVEMIRQIRAYGLEDERILAAMSKVRRHRFIPADLLGSNDPYGDHPCPIGHGQTISQPFIVAYMTQKIDPRPGERILEIGTGSGYQAAILTQLGADVFSMEIIPQLADHAKKILPVEGFRVNILEGNGYLGWPQMAPFDAVIVTCAAEELPTILVEQVRDGGRMILPLGNPGFQRLTILRKNEGKLTTLEDLAVRFVPMVSPK